MDDPIRQNARNGGLVIWEESARDGAQAKTMMTAPERIEIARRTGALFGEAGPAHVIFGAGFPSIGAQEVEVMRQLAEQVDNCSLASHGRPSPDDIDLALRALDGAAHPRVTFFIAVSDAMAGALRLGTPASALEQGLAVLQHALDRGDGIPVDVTLADASRADPAFCLDAVLKLSEAGASVVKACDSMGVFRPGQAQRYYARLCDGLPDDVVLGTHQHNDFGLALANNLAAIDAGLRVIATSWLGLGERNGLAPTEQLLFALTQGDDGDDLWIEQPRISELAPIARQVAAFTGVPVKVTDPVVGTGVNTISTGTPFLDKTVFRPYDPALVGLEDEILVTQMISSKVVGEIMAEEGIVLDRSQANDAMQWVKDRTYREGRAVLDRSELLAYVRSNLLGLADVT